MIDTLKSGVSGNSNVAGWWDANVAKVSESVPLLVCCAWRVALGIVLSVAVFLLLFVFV